MHGSLVVEKNIASTNPDPVPTASLEAVLAELTKFGRPHLWCTEKMKWYCTISVFITAIGAKFDVASDFERATPLNAAEQCLDRLRETMKNVQAIAAPVK